MIFIGTMGVGKPDVLKRSIDRLRCYDKIDKSQLSIDETVIKIMEIIG